MLDKCKQVILTKFLKGRDFLLLSTIILLGSVLRLYQLGKQSLWLDEAYSVMMSKDLFVLWCQQLKDSSPPLYYSILHYWAIIFGNTEFSLRLLSALLGILLIPLLFISGKIIFNRTVGIYSALLAAISPIHIYYSQEIKMYSLLPLLSLASFLLLYLGIKRRGYGYWTGYAITTILCIYTHNYGILLLFAEICYFIFFFCKDRSILPKFFLAQACIFLVCSPRFLVIANQIAMYMNPWIALPALKDLKSTFIFFCLSSWRLPLSEILIVSFNIMIPVFMFIFLFGIFSKQKLFLLAYFIPLLLTFLLSFKIHIYVPGRYDILVFPAFCLTIAAGLNRITLRFLRKFLLAIIIAATFISLYHYYFIYNKSSDSFVVNYLQSRMGERDVVVATELSITPFEYYWSESFSPRLFQFPEGPRAYLVENALKGDQKYIDLEIEKLVEKIYPLLSRDNKLWVLYQPMKFSRCLVERLNNDLDCESDVLNLPGCNLNQVQRILVFRKRM